MTLEQACNFNGTLRAADRAYQAAIDDLTRPP